MPNSPIKSYQNRATSRRNPSHSPKHYTQHGFLDQDASRGKANRGQKWNLLLGLPTESLTHITAFLDPQSLLALNRVNKRLHQHVEDDNTWRRAFACQFLGISPEADMHATQMPNKSAHRVLMLRREEDSWKKEFITRWNLRRRWERSRPSPISHIPVHSHVSSIHLMQSSTSLASIPPAVATSSLQYGIVARSYPLTGKVLRGYLDASGTMNGIGVGNPNAEFSPDLTQCAMTTEGNTLRVLWGFQTGMVAVTTAPKAMETARAVGARWLRSSRVDSHEGAVEALAWVNARNGSSFFVTGSTDGTVKVWDTKRVSCMWTSEVETSQLLHDPCVKVAVDVVQGVVTAVMKSGKMLVWSGFSALFSDDGPVQQSAIKTHAIAHPPPRVQSPAPTTSPRPLQSLHLDCTHPGSVSLLTLYTSDSFFIRTTIDLASRETAHIAFRDECSTPFSTVHPIFATKPDEFSFVLVGDTLGCVSIFPWDSDPTVAVSSSSENGSTCNSDRLVLPSVKFEAHVDGAVTTIAWTPSTLLTGSSNGSIRAFDSLTFELLRTFMTSTTLPQSSEIKQIIAVRDFFVASAGNRVVAWRGEPVGKHASHNMKGKRIQRTTSGVAKWQQQVEIHNEIAESRREMEYEQTRTRRIFGREREQRSTLQNLGLSEVEAVEYVLMLSRDEEERRRQQEAQGSTGGDMISGEFDEDIQTPMDTRASFIEGPPTTSLQFGSASNRTTPPRSSSSLFESRIQISSRYGPEPMEASFSTSAPISAFSSLSSGSGGSREHLPSPDDPRQFPSISSTPTHRSGPGSPQSHRSAWGTPLKVNHSPSSGGPSSPRGSVSSVASSPVARAPSMPLLAASFAHLAMENRNEEEEDEDLRFAIELSLAEARSRGENV